MKKPLVDVRCFSHLGMTVADLDMSISFYEDVLGFVRKFDDVHEAWTRVGLAVGDVMIELFSPLTMPATGDAVDPFYPTQLGRPKITLTVSDVEGTYARLANSTVTVLCPVTSTSKSRFFIIADPDGTPIQLHEFNGRLQRVVELFG